jgi:glucosamine--fructose-6-phosphate aminotransferase (isomerizing)
MCGIIGYAGHRMRSASCWMDFGVSSIVATIQRGWRSRPRPGSRSAGVQGRSRGSSRSSSEPPWRAQRDLATRGGRLTASRPTPPHADCTGRLVVVHNGIIENHSIEDRRESQRHRFQSETDTEDRTPSSGPRRRLRSAALSGGPPVGLGVGAVWVLQYSSGRIVAVKRGAGAVIGPEARPVASDIPAVTQTRTVGYPGDDEVAEITPGRVVLPLEGGGGRSPTVILERRYGEKGATLTSCSRRSTSSRRRRRHLAARGPREGGRAARGEPDTRGHRSARTSCWSPRTSTM